MSASKSVLTRLFRPRRDRRDALRPLWHAAVALSRQERWYRHDGVADSLAGRFDMIALVTALVLLRMERDPLLADRSALLTELFVEDMDGQLRESGVGDMVVGKHVGRLVSVLGGRLGALREALAGDGGADLESALERNVTMLEGASPAPLALDVRSLYARLLATEAEALLDGALPVVDGVA